MIRIDVKIQITEDDAVWFDDDKDKFLGISEAFVEELAFFPECLDIILGKIKHKLNDHIRNEADEEFKNKS